MFWTRGMSHGPSFQFRASPDDGCLEWCSWQGIAEEEGRELKKMLLPAALRLLALARRSRFLALPLALRGGFSESRGADTPCSPTIHLGCPLASSPSPASLLLLLRSIFSQNLYPVCGSNPRYGVEVLSSRDARPAMGALGLSAPAARPNARALGPPVSLFADSSSPIPYLQPLTSQH